ncbi:MAG: polyprenyl synthetase family protein [Alphaproteobacteria bacterium]|nr:polyprenyl synthetase family protein [Alphaproteobacteria bacterium]
MSDFMQKIEHIAKDTDRILNEYIAPGRWSDDPANIGLYATLDKGKRLRPFLTVAAGKLFDVPYESALRAGTCIEMVHNFSLIHDDLPCMDNDEVRNNKPSAWKKFGEWQAILGGDFLNSLGFYPLATDDKITTDANTRLELIKTLSKSIIGMCQGQYMDIMSESGMFHNPDEIDEIQILKTGCIFNACTGFAAILGNASEAEREALRKFTLPMGLCFQVTDDLLDVVGDADKVGKTLNKDGNKATYPKILGVDGARAKARELADAAKAELAIFGDRADSLRELMDWMVERDF